MDKGIENDRRTGEDALFLGSFEICLNLLLGSIKNNSLVISNGYMLFLCKYLLWHGKCIIIMASTTKHQIKREDER